MTTQTIPEGGAEYTWPLTITETSGRDIRSATVSLSLGNEDEPNSWASPDVDTSPGNNARTVQMLVDSNVSAGTYWLWSKLVLSPETIIRCQFKIIVK